jgi:RNA polymerase sigma factor (sigma-70 family)
MGDKPLYNIEGIIKYHVNSVIRFSPLSRTELFQIGYIGYLTATRKHDPEVGNMTLDYVGGYIKAAMMKAIKSEYKESYNTLQVEDKEVLENNTAEIEQNPTAVSQIQKIKSVLPFLPEIERKIVYDTYLATKTKILKELSAELNISKQRIHQIKTRAINKIRILIQREEDDGT